MPSTDLETTDRATVDIWLIRHGESESNAGLPSMDPAGIALTEHGYAQARAVSEWISTTPAKIVTSNYLRAQQTAEALQQKYSDVPVEQWPVHEFTFLPSSDYYKTTVEQRQRLIDQYWQAEKPHEIQGAGAESFAQFVTRLADVNKSLLHQTEGPIAVFSHRKFISGLVWVLITGKPKISARRMRRFRGFDLGMSLKNGAIIPVTVHAGKASVGPMATGHLNGN